MLNGSKKHILVTGGAGFIGSHLVDRLLDDGWAVTVIDNFDPYYDPAQKRRNINSHIRHPCHRIEEVSVEDAEQLDKVAHSYKAIVHLAAKAGVRPSLDRPDEYHRVNVMGTQNMLEKAKEWGVPQFIFGSSSSVYGTNSNMPWTEEDSDLRPISPYASTKLSGEMLGHVYSYNYDLRFLSLRFFTVYGARQRPDLAIHKFARRMLDENPIPLYGDGSTFRDYTHVSDIVSGIMSAIEYAGMSYGIFNLGNGTPVTLDELVTGLERALGVEAKRNYRPIPPGDVPHTLASIKCAQEHLEYQPAVELDAGLKDFVAWLTQQPCVAKEQPSSSGIGD